jgi:hypothetical protein
MTQRSTANSDVRKLREDQRKLVTALKTLFDLLEDYAPHWYAQEHHDIASDALASVSRRKSPSPFSHRLKDAA